MKMEGKIICCCGFSGCTKAIGWFEVVLSGILILSLTFGLVVFTGTRAIFDNVVNDGNYWEVNEEKPLISEEIQNFRMTSNITIVVLFLRLIFEIFAFVMALFLLRGSYGNNPRYLDVWMIYTEIFLILGTIQIVILCIFDCDEQIAPIIVTLVIWFSIQSFCLWVVNVEKKKMRASAWPQFPLKTKQPLDLAPPPYYFVNAI